MSETIVSVQDVQFSYPTGVRALKGVSLEVKQGERVAILGPNGSGKSTLILLIAGLLNPSKGQIKVFGQETSSKNFPKLRSRIGIVFQDPDDQLFTPSVKEDIEYGPRNLGLPSEVINKRCNHILEDIGISHLKDRSPHRLSFGEKKKVSLATALILTPELLILDEPTANLDLASRRGLIEMLNALNAEGTTIIISTHDVEALPELAERVIVMAHGSLLGEGEMHKVLQDVELLESAGLELPSIARLFNKLKGLGLVNVIPITYEEALNFLQETLKRD
ncbi:MAG: energy-coupling factor ABC transporter ATP-binding protein [Candidatus Bathyarchaeota archaeon]|nr:energy-coupling factor ABC transporter ATP-binding protein [Candidatus Bathyarchaeota archaeon]